MISRIQSDYYNHKVKSNLHRKTAIYLRDHQLTYRYVLRAAVEHLSEAEYARGPSPHHWLIGNDVFEFILVLNDADIDVKFDVNDKATLFESFHNREKNLDDSWFRLTLS